MAWTPAAINPSRKQTHRQAMNHGRSAAGRPFLPCDSALCAQDCAERNPSAQSSCRPEPGFPETLGPSRWRRRWRGTGWYQRDLVHRRQKVPCTRLRPGENAPLFLMLKRRPGFSIDRPHDSFVCVNAPAGRPAGRPSPVPRAGFHGALLFQMSRCNFQEPSRFRKTRICLPRNMTFPLWSRISASETSVTV